MPTVAMSPKAQIVEKKTTPKVINVPLKLLNARNQTAMMTKITIGTIFAISAGPKRANLPSTIGRPAT